MVVIINRSTRLIKEECVCLAIANTMSRTTIGITTRVVVIKPSSNVVLGKAPDSVCSGLGLLYRLMLSVSDSGSVRS